jgi:hypothetical protein
VIHMKYSLGERAYKHISNFIFVNSSVHLAVLILLCSGRSRNRNAYEVSPLQSPRSTQECYGQPQNYEPYSSNEVSKIY